MSIILDAIIVLIILLFVFLSAKKGFVRTLIEVVGFIAAIAIALSISTPIANFCYDSAIQPIVTKTVESAVNEGGSNVNQAVDAVWNKLPAFLTESNFFNISKESITSSINDETASDTAQLIDSINSLVKPAISKLISVILSVILVVILLFLVKLLAKVVNKLFSFSLVGDINKTLGGILGLVKGAAVSVIFCMIISLILSFTKDGFLIFTYDAINSSHLFKFIMGISPFL